MWTISELKQRGNAAFRANYWRSVLCAFLLSLFAGSAVVNSRSGGGESGESISNSFQQMTPEQQFAIGAILVGTVSIVMIVSILLKIFLFNPLTVGCYGFFKENIASGGTTDLDVLRTGFSNYGHTFVTLLLRDLFLLLWTMLLFIPGIIKAYSYMMVPFILRDEPDLSATEVITRSREMMNGHKWRAFLLDLSFIGWFLLSILTLGILNIFWTSPYHESTRAALYLELSQSTDYLE